MATALSATYRSYDLPWSATPEEKSRLQRSLQVSVGIVLLLCLLVPYLPLPERRGDVLEAVPPRLAKLVIEKRAPPPPPPVPEARDVPPETAPPVAAPLPQPQAVWPEPAPADRTDQARRKASSAGLLPFEDQLAALRDNTAAQKAAQTRNLTGAVGETTRSERSLITSGVGKGSGGINTAALSRGYGGGSGALNGHETTQVAAPFGGGGGGGTEVRRSTASTKAARSREEIELVFDRNKSAIYALYSRALRDNPTLQGKLVLEITIAPSGEVTACEVVSSDLKDPDLERKLIARIKLFRFEEKDVEAITTTKPIDFFPA